MVSMTTATVQYATHPSDELMKALSMRYLVMQELLGEDADKLEVNGEEERRRVLVRIDRMKDIERWALMSVSDLASEREYGVRMLKQASQEQAGGR